jgi:hypothetical protein
VTQPEPEPDPDRPTMAPFLGALALVVLIVIGIVLFNVFGDDDPTPEQSVRLAVVGQNDAMQRQSYQDFRTYTCRGDQGNESEFLARQRDSVAKNGARTIAEVFNVRIGGDRATADVTYGFEKTVDTTSGSELNVMREDGAWKVCESGAK